MAGRFPQGAVARIMAGGRCGTTAALLVLAMAGGGAERAHAQAVRSELPSSASGTISSSIVVPVSACEGGGTLSLTDFNGTASTTW